MHTITSPYSSAESSHRSYAPHVLDPRAHYSFIANLSRDVWTEDRGAYLQMCCISPDDAVVVASAEYDTANFGEIVLSPDLVQCNCSALSRALSCFS